MKHQFFALSLGIGAMILATDHAFAEPASCAPRDRVLDRLATTYGETRRSIGLSGEEGVVEVFASDDTGTWTITLTLPTGQTCLCRQRPRLRIAGRGAAAAGARGLAPRPFRPSGALALPRPRV